GGGERETERERGGRVDGVEGVAAEYGTLTDRVYLEKVIASLGNRVFLLHNINQNQPKLFQSRWALSFLRGPMTREEVGRVMEPIKRAPPAAVAAKLCNHCGAEVPPGVGNRCPQCGKNPWEPASSTAPVARVATVATGAAAATVAVPAAPAPTAQASVRYTQPVLPPDVTQFYLPVSGSPPAGHELEYQPWVLGFAEVAFPIDKRKGTEHKLTLRLLAKPPQPGHPIDWDHAMPINLEPAPRPQPRARWAAVPESLDTGRKLSALEKVFADHLYSTQKIALFENRELEMISLPGEPLETFKR